MKDDFYDKVFAIFIAGVIVIFILFIVVFVKVVIDTIQDHKCYMMSDKEFYSSEQCKPYWSYRGDKSE